MQTSTPPSRRPALCLPHCREPAHPVADATAAVAAAVFHGRSTLSLCAVRLVAARLLGALTLLVLGGLAQAADRLQRMPNVLVILTDNQGAWTLGCYGNPDIRTPNIDRLAAEGILFEQAYACNPVCSPNRATLLTGLMPSQHGVHSYLVSGRLQIGPQARSTLAAFRSLGEILKEHGYVCGLVGKWHLGANLTPQEGFDDYWVTMPHGHTSTFYGAEVIEGGKIRREPGYLTDFWTDHAVRFLKQVAGGGRPFFLLLAYNGPYGLGRHLLRPARNRHARYYADKRLLSFPRRPPHPWLYNNREYLNNIQAIRRVAAETSGVDDGVGRVLATLEELRLRDRTVVVYLADQGWVGGQGGFWGMGDHTRPFTLRDGMLRIPMIWSQPGRIPPARRCGELVSIYDVPVTILDYCGLGQAWRDNRARPGRSLRSLLEGRADAGGHDAVYMEYQHVRAVRTRRWKYVYRYPSGPHELYDVSRDPDESQNLWDRLPKKRQALHEQLLRFFARYAEPRYDLWHGGSSQSRLLK